MGISLKARVVYPVDRPPIEHGVVTIEGERIDSVCERAAGGDVADLGDVALLPGLVNAHTHLEFSHLRQPLGQPGMSLPDWIRLVIAERGHGNQDAHRNSIIGLSDSEAAGVITIGDITTCTNSLRYDVTQFHEVIGFSRARAESAKNALMARIDLFRSASRETRYGISPHAPYTVSPKLLSALIEISRKHDLPVAMHIAESLEELQLLRDGTGPFQELLDERSMWDANAIPRGSRPMDYLRMLAAAPRALVIHGNYLDEEELSFLASNRERMSLVYCPRTHAYFFHRAYPLAKALATGVRVSVGTDSRASNPDLDLLAEMRFLAKTHPTVVSHEILWMGTLSGAEALGASAILGALHRGSWRI